MAVAQLSSLLAPVAEEIEEVPGSSCFLQKAAGLRLEPSGEHRTEESFYIVF